MTKFRHLVLIVGVIALCTAPLHAGIVFQFDELGDLAYSLSGAPFVPMANGTLEADPTSGVSGDVLVYNLTPELFTFEMYNGDVPIAGYGGLAGDLRFTDPSGDLTGNETCGTVECLMIFYSFVDNGFPADVDPPSTSFLLTQTPGTTLTGGDFTYTAGVVTYDGTIVPEPAPAAMLLSGLAGVFLIRKRSRAK
jgi:hypothetical protein